MDFEEYWRNGCFGEYHDIYAKNLAKQFYNAGQQSKQAEIDAIKSKLSDIYDASDEDETVAHLLDEIQELLK